MAAATTDCDLLVVGSGAAGLVAAAVAALEGLEVVVAEKMPRFGGTTARSEGQIWVPCSRQAAQSGGTDSLEAAIAYVQAVTGPHFDRPMVEAYVHAAPAMLAYVEDRTPVRYLLAPYANDYYSDRTGATSGLRSLSPAVYDARAMGPLFESLQPPLASTMILGGMTITSHDLPHFYRIGRSLASSLHVAGMTLRYARDRLAGFSRGTRIGNANGVLAALLATLQPRGVRLWAGARVRELAMAAGRVTGASLERDGERHAVRARRGVLLAGGGFPADPELTRRFYPHVRAGKPHHTLTPEGNSGDGVRLGLAAGGALRTDLSQPAAWTPVSLVPQRDGSRVPFPHYVDRAKPGVIAVDRRGRRFTNEAQTYQEFVPAMVTACRDDPTVEVYLLADHRALRRYGLGVVPPFPGRIGPYLRSGYLVRGSSPGELATRLGLDPAALETTIARYNGPAARGEDPEFGKGSSLHNRGYGDPGVGPNPCVAPLASPPFYGVRLLPGDIGTFFGLACDGEARVLDASGRPIAGLYAAGNDMASPFGGTYLAPGITVGAAMTFGYLAARHVIETGSIGSKRSAT